MEQTEQQAVPSLSSFADHAGFQNILIDTLRTALIPMPLKEKVTRILDSLLMLDHLHLGTKAALFLVNPDSNTLELLVGRGFPSIRAIACKTIKPGFCHCGQTVKTGETAFFTNPPPLSDNALATTPFPGNYCVPIIKDSHILGVFTVYVSPRHRHSDELSEMLEAIANILAIIIESQQMDQQLIQLVNDLRGSIINLREEKKFSESVIQGLNHGLIVADLNGKIRKSNSVAQAIFKPFTKQLDGKYLADFLGDSASAELLSTTPVKSGQMEKELTFFTPPTRDKKIIGYSNVPREDTRGNKVGVIISLSDISELKYVRKEMEKMNRLSTVAEIASAVAHEVRNPLAGIKIMAQSIEEESKDNSDQLECSQRIIRQVDRLNELLTDFFSYARPAEPNKRPTSLNSIITETMPLINNRLTKNHITLSQDVSDKLPPIIADPHQVQQVFLNLFLNAIDAIKKQGRIEIYASILTPSMLRYYKKKNPALLGDYKYIIVNFTDNGTGMPLHVAEQVFEPFFTTKTSGAGLGLAIVYRTLKENDAEIVLDSKEGKGTTFTIFFRTDV